MNEVLFEFRADDQEIRKALDEAFGSEREVIEVDRFEGAIELMQIIVPVTAATMTALSTILVTYFKARAQERSHRKVIYDGRTLRTEGLSAEDVIKIVSATKGKK